MQKRFDSFLEEGEIAAKVMGQRRAKLEEAGTAAQRLLQELPADFPARFQQVESQVLQMSSEDFNGQQLSNPRHSQKKEEKNLDSSLEEMRLAIQLQGLSKAFKSLEERFSTMQSRLSRNEKTSQQALAQARHLETMISGLPTRVEDQISFQNLRRQVKEMSKTLAAASLSVSAEDFEELQRKVFNLEHRLDHLSPGTIDVASADSKDEPAERRKVASFRQGYHGQDGQDGQDGQVAMEGLHFADGTVESSEKVIEDQLLRSPKRSQASPSAASPSRISRSTEEPSWDRLANLISP